MRNNLTSWFSGGTKNRELDETRAEWERVQAAWHASWLSKTGTDELSHEIVREGLRGLDRMPTPPVVDALCKATEALLDAECIGGIEPFWNVVQERVEVAVEFRQMLARRAAWVSQHERFRAIVS